MDLPYKPYLEFMGTWNMLWLRTLKHGVGNEMAIKLNIVTNVFYLLKFKKSEFSLRIFELIN